MLPLKSFRSLRDFRRKASECFYEAWQSQNPSLYRFCFATQRALFANLLLFRHSGWLVFRRVNERYWSLHTAWRKELRLLQAQRILLGGCLISFAQDKITDEELMSTIKNFTTQPDRVPEIPEKTVPVYMDNSQSESKLSSGPSDSAESSDRVTPKISRINDRFNNPPLTLIVRQLKKDLSELTAEFMRPKHTEYETTTTNTTTKQVPDDGVSSPPKILPVVKSADDTVGDYFSTALSSLEFHPDGTGFVDETWDLIVDRQDLRIWRRPIESNRIVKAQTAESNGKVSDPGISGIPTAKYEYRLSGTMKDISALSFLEVQLNLSYRRHWDDRVVSLEYLNRSSDADQSVDVCPTGDLIRWVARFPFPLAQREYVYARRWWLESAPSPETSAVPEGASDNGDAPERPNPPQHVSYGRHALVLSRSCIPLDISSSSSSSATQSTRPGENGISSAGEPSQTQGWADRFKSSTVLVTTYRSEMLIQSHGRFDELGMNYYLIYCDDPRLPVGDSTFSVVTGKAMNQFISQLHSAALALNRRGMPPGVEPVVFRARTPRAVRQSIPDRTQRPNGNSPEDATELPESKPQFYADYTPETSPNISNVAY